VSERPPGYHPRFMTGIQGTTAGATTGAPRFSTLIALAWPMIVARLSQAVIGFCDALRSAPLGEAPLAAVTAGALDVMLVVILPMGTVFIIQSFAAQLRGGGRAVEARRYANYGLLISAAAGALGLAAIPWVDATLSLFDYTPEVRTAMGEYLRIRLWSVAAIVGVEALGNWYGGLGNTRVSLLAGLLGMASNVVLNYALILPRFGLPGYGIAGAAWASVLASWIAFAVVWALYMRGIGHGLPKGGGRFRADEFRRVLRFGVPSGFNWFLEFAAFALFVNGVVPVLGTHVVAAFNVVIYVNMVSFMPAFGAASAGAILVGEAIGAKRFEHVNPSVRLTLVSNAVWMSTIGLVYLAFGKQIFGLFAPPGSETSALLDTGALLLTLSAIWQVFDAGALTFSEALRASGDTRWPMLARLGLAWGVFIPGAYLAIHHLGGGPSMLVACMTAYIGLLAVLLFFRFRSGRWASIRLVKEASVGPEVAPFA